MRYQMVFLFLLVAVVNSYAVERKGKGTEALAKQAVKDTLRDPSSVQFRDIQKNSAGDVCGQYNAKNSYGGYVGFENFMYDKRGGLLVNDELLKTEARLNELEQKLEGITSRTTYSEMIVKMAERELREKYRLIQRIRTCEAESL